MAAMPLPGGPDTRLKDQSVANTDTPAAPVAHDSAPQSMVLRRHYVAYHPTVLEHRLFHHDSLQQQCPVRPADAQPVTLLAPQRHAHQKCAAPDGHRLPTGPTPQKHGQPDRYGQRNQCRAELAHSIANSDARQQAHGYHQQGSMHLHDNKNSKILPATDEHGNRFCVK